jgi:hypothetical protein
MCSDRKDTEDVDGKGLVLDEGTRGQGDKGTSGTRRGGTRGQGDGATGR